MTLALGTWKARGVEGSEQYGTSTKGTDQIGINVEFVDGPNAGLTATTVLFFSEAAAEFSIDRLRALGWTGTDLADLRGISQNEVQVRVKAEMVDGEEKTKVEILTGGGGFKFANQMDDRGKRAFAARYRHLVAGSRPQPAPAQQSQRPQHRVTHAPAPQQGYPSTWDDASGPGAKDPFA